MSYKQTLTSEYLGKRDGDAQNARTKLPQRRDKAMQTHDPVRRIVAAVALQALVDLLEPHKYLSRLQYRHARQFLLENRDLYIKLGIPRSKVEALCDQFTD